MTDRIAYIQDQLLVMDAQAGSRVALEELVRRWYTKLWQHAYNLTSDQQAAWDIAQKSWCDIIRLQSAIRALPILTQPLF